MTSCSSIVHLISIAQNSGKYCFPSVLDFVNLSFSPFYGAVGYEVSEGGWEFLEQVNKHLLLFFIEGILSIEHFVEKDRVYTAQGLSTLHPLVRSEAFCDPVDEQHDAPTLALQAYPALS